ncbi:MAG: hypothetical protein NTY96_00595 [Bacteroidetes bacterium]|nr:hypothetical protein [Bacteroidota bacterium]
MVANFVTAIYTLTLKTIKISLQVLTRATYGQSGNYTVSFFNIGAQQIQGGGSGTASIANGTISGPTDVCGLNTDLSFTLTLPPYHGPSISWTWNVNQSGWKINGSTPSVTVTSTSVTITTPNQASNSTVSITSGSWLCSSKA